MSSAPSERSTRPKPARSSYPGWAPTSMPSLRQRHAVPIDTDADPACTPHAMFALSMQARIASSSPAPSPMSELTFTNPDSLGRPRSSVLRVAVEELDRVPKHRHHGFERFGGASGTARHVDDQRLPSHAGDPPGEGRHRRARLTRPAP